MTFQILHAAMSEINVNLWRILLHETTKSPFPSDRLPNSRATISSLAMETVWMPWETLEWEGEWGASVAVRRTSVHPARPNENATIFVQPSNHSSVHSELLLPLFLRT